jgi:DNA topoisomerase-1
MQDAHEAIRVIDPYLTPEKIKTQVGHDEYALYKLI